jgi:two-component system, sensor histidine kinase and response regulator
LIISDVMMPPPNGFEFKKLVAQDPETATIPFIFLTARTGMADKVYGFESGADDYITKPFNDQELLARIKAILRRTRTQQQQALVDINEQMEALRQQVLQQVTHELHLPLVNIMASLEMVLMQKHIDPQEQQLFFQTALTSAHFLRGLIDDIVILTDMDQNKLNTFRQPVNLRTDFNDVIHQTMERFQGKALEVYIGIGDGVNLSAPRNEFRRAVAHLVENACKFSPVRGRIDISLRANNSHNGGDGGAILTVSDQGPGIPVELRQKVFERYFQYNAARNVGYGGLGIGLTIARALARSLQGDVVILDTPYGCKVQMTIPGVVFLNQPGSADDILRLS